MIKKGFVFILLLSGLVSCSEEMKHNRIMIKKDYKADLINFDHCFTEKESRVSFPLFFNDSLIREYGIKTIKRSFMNMENEQEDSEVKEVRTYVFNEDGTVMKVSVVQYYEHSPMSEVSFLYPEGIDEYGFGDVVVEGVKKDEVIADHYDLFIKEEYTDKYLVYVNKRSGNYLFYLKNSINWGSVSVDSILQPTPDDIVVYGLPNQSVKEYKVENKVNEFEVNTVEYIGDENAVGKLTFERYPFEYRRTIEYNDKGVSTGFIDSTFTRDQFLIRRVTSIRRDKKGLPDEISHINDTDEKEGFVQIEKFEYEYRKK